MIFDLYLPDHLECVGELYDSLDVDIVQATLCQVARAAPLAA
jgi:hypothetical protein